MYLITFLTTFLLSFLNIFFNVNQYRYIFVQANIKSFYVHELTSISRMYKMRNLVFDYM